LNTTGSPGLNGGEDILRILQGQPRAERVLALVRHAERFRLPPSRKGNHDASGLLLTPDGHAAARRLGRDLPRSRSLRVHHSPSPRAEETAWDILGGFREFGDDPSSAIGETEPLLSTFFGSTVDESRRLRLKRELGGGKALLRAWMDGGVPTDVLRPASEARARLLDMLRLRLRKAKAPSMEMLVSHDFTIILLGDWLFGVRFEDCAWPAYLDGIVFSEARDGRLSAAWRDRIVGLPRVVALVA
jgi:broad specificity phosphatase PhoE